MHRVVEASERLMSIKQVAGLLGVSRRSVHRLIAGGQLATIRVTERRVMVAPSDYETYVRGRRVPARA